jgi:lipid II:glycine glycyltransferase (peptidoglycan interpeptide bridge formation enzyme)
MGKFDKTVSHNVLYKNFGVCISESWYSFEEGSVKTDLDYIQQTENPAKDYSYILPYDTLVLDLTESEEELFKKLKKDTRYEIIRASERDKIKFSVDKIDDLKVFIDFYNLCQNYAKLASLNEERLELYHKKNLLFISYTQDPQDAHIISAHCYLSFPEKVRLLFACSLRSKTQNNSGYNSLVGRANRFHHWKDIIILKSLGKVLLDFGGWYEGSNKRFTSISKFKEEFGGKRRSYYTCVRVNTLKGRLYMLMKFAYLALRNRNY